MKWGMMILRGGLRRQWAVVILGVWSVEQVKGPSTDWHHSTGHVWLWHWYCPHAWRRSTPSSYLPMTPPPHVTRVQPSCGRLISRSTTRHNIAAWHTVSPAMGEPSHCTGCPVRLVIASQMKLLLLLLLGGVKMEYRGGGEIKEERGEGRARPFRSW